MPELTTVQREREPAAPVMWEEVPCNQCGSSDRAVFLSGLRDWSCKGPGTFTLVRCQNCTLVYLNPRPTEPDIGRYYTDEYIPHVRAVVARRSPTWMRRAAKAVAALPYRVRFGTSRWYPHPWGDRKALDVGCGTGGNLYELQQLGWEVYGIDPSTDAVRQARALLNTENIFEGTLRTVSLPPATFDLVVMWHSLEHMHDPRGSLEYIYRILGPGGRLKIAVPNIGSWEARFFGRCWSGNEVPRHLYLFSRESLAGMVSAAGYQVALIRPHFMPVSVADSIDQWIERCFGVRWRRPQQKLTYYLSYWFAVWSYVFGNNGFIELDAFKS